MQVEEKCEIDPMEFHIFEDDFLATDRQVVDISVKLNNKTNSIIKPIECKTN